LIKSDASARIAVVNLDGEDPLVAETVAVDVEFSAANGVEVVVVVVANKDVNVLDG
jgi:siroheme synthase